jgi:hypothetical protein
MGQLPHIERMARGHRGNPFLAWADFLTKELFRYIMAFGEEKHKWQA